MPCLIPYIECWFYLVKFKTSCNEYETNLALYDVKNNIVG